MLWTSILILHSLFPPSQVSTHRHMHTSSFNHEDFGARDQDLIPSGFIYNNMHVKYSKQITIWMNWDISLIHKTLFLNMYFGTYLVAWSEEGTEASPCHRGDDELYRKTDTVQLIITVMGTQRNAMKTWTQFSNLDMGTEFNLQFKVEGEGDAYRGKSKGNRAPSTCTKMGKHLI